MIVKRIENATRVLGAPNEWEDENGKCLGLPVRDLQLGDSPVMVSAWEPTLKELQALMNGETLKLWVIGVNHPVVAMTVGPVE